ncbi:MAG: tRNA threonylcarbamoyladenosine dehydratase [Clostridia bacterium]|nr:tRNA threonylcarbamoyladenosine dehydratase [Clostridia bacterium]
MKEEFSRTAMLIGEAGLEKLNKSKVIVFGTGGVGSYAVEALARCGLERLDVVDADVVSVTNINRQLIALHSTVGRKKVEVVKERIADISPDTLTDAYDIFYDCETKDKIDLSIYDYIVDAIDSMNSKILLIKEAKRLNVPIISALSAGNKMDVTKFQIADIFDTSVCPIAKILRKRLREEKVDKLKVVYSTEPPILADSSFVADDGKKTVGSISFVPSAVGLMLASEVICDLTDFRR